MRRRVFLLTTDPGLEDVAADEVREAVGSDDVRHRPYDHAGQVRATAAEAGPLLRLTTVHDVIELSGESEAASRADLERALAVMDFPVLERAASFRVTTKFAAPGGIERMEVQRAAGAVIQRRYRTPVDLENFEVNVRVEWLDDHLIAGIQRNRASLGNRIRRARSLRTALKPTVAAAMLRLAGAHHGAGRLIDPLCGTGTIPVEARRINPALEVLACDWDEETVETARGTVANHGLDVEVRQWDARVLDSGYPQPFDYIVTDPPYGVRQARRCGLVALYGELLQAFERSLKPSGRLVLVALKVRSLMKALAPTGLRIGHERVIDLGGIHPRIFLLLRG